MMARYMRIDDGDLRMIRICRFVICETEIAESGERRRDYHHRMRRREMINVAFS